MDEPVSERDLNFTLPLAQVKPWVEGLCRRYKSDEWNDYFVGKRGLTNRIQGELVPLAFLCEALSQDRQNELLRYFYGVSQSFDAQLLAPNGQITETLEVTLACDGYRDSIAGEYLIKYGWAPMWVPLSYAGRRGSRELPPPEVVSMDAEQIVADGLQLIREAVSAKSDSKKYVGANLVVGLEDFRFLQRHFELVKTELEKIVSPFLAIYYVGLGGRFFHAHLSAGQI